MSSRALARAANTPPTPDTTTVTVDGYIVITINGQDFVLDGTVGTDIIVEYHKSFDEAFPVGTIGQIITMVADALGLGSSDFGTKFQAAVNSIPITGVANALNQMVVKVTDIGINTSTKVYQFGICADLSAVTPPLQLNSLMFKGFGVKFTYANTGT